MAKTNLGKVSITPKGAYNELTAYEKLDVVSYNGSSFLVLKNVQGVVPIDDEENYMLLAKKGENGSGGGGSYSLPIAAPDTLGGVQPVAKTSEMTEAVGVDGTGKLFTKPGASGGGGSYTLPVASADTLGGVKVGNNLSITEDGTLNATGGGSGGGERPWEFFKEYPISEFVGEFTIGNQREEDEFARKKYTELVIEIKMKKTNIDGEECYVCINGGVSRGIKLSNVFNASSKYDITDKFIIKLFGGGTSTCFAKTSFGPTKTWELIEQGDPLESIKYIYLLYFKLEPGSTIKVWGR